MLVKKPNQGNIFFKSIKLVIALEVALFGGSYLVWKQMNTSRDFRLFMYKRAPFILNQFYSFGQDKNPNYTLEMDDKTYWRQNNLL